jgi:hypothetical protein
LTALTTIEEIQTATMAPPPYNRTVDLFSRASHCEKYNNTVNKIILMCELSKINHGLRYLLFQIRKDIIALNRRGVFR